MINLLGLVHYGMDDPMLLRQKPEDGRTILEREHHRAYLLHTVDHSQRLMFRARCYAVYLEFSLLLQTWHQCIFY